MGAADRGASASRGDWIAVPLGVIEGAYGGALILAGTMQGVLGILYAADVLHADPAVKGLMPNPGNRRNL